MKYLFPRLILAAIILVSLGMFTSKTLERRRASQSRQLCASNLKKIGYAVIMYAMDNDECFPRASTSLSRRRATWVDSIVPYTQSNDIFHCPDDGDSPGYQPNTGRYGSYVINNAYYTPRDAYTGPAGLALSRINEPAFVVLAAEGADDFQLAWAGAANTPKITGTNPKRFGSLVERHGMPLYCDGHVLGHGLQHWLRLEQRGRHTIATGLTVERD